MVIQERWVVNKRPDDILSDCEALVFELFLAQLNRTPHLLQLGVGWDRRLGGDKLGFKLLHLGVFAGRLLGGHQVGLQFCETFVLLAKDAEQDLAIGIGSLVFRFGDDCGDVGGQTEIERRPTFFQKQQEQEGRSNWSGGVWGGRQDRSR